MTYHNPVNYARGLLVELEGAERLDRTEVAAEVRVELGAVSEALGAVNPDVLSVEARDNWVDVSSRVAEALGSEGAEDGGKHVRAGGGRKGPRNAAAAAAPERAVPPAAK